MAGLQPTRPAPPLRVRAPPLYPKLFSSNSRGMGKSRHRPRKDATIPPRATLSGLMPAPFHDSFSEPLRHPPSVNRSHRSARFRRPNRSQSYKSCLVDPQVYNLQAIVHSDSHPTLRKAIAKPRLPPPAKVGASRQAVQLRRATQQLDLRAGAAAPDEETIALDTTCCCFPARSLHRYRHRPFLDNEAH